MSAIQILLLNVVLVVCLNYPKFNPNITLFSQYSLNIALLELNIQMPGVFICN